LDNYSKLSPHEQGRVFGHDVLPTAAAFVVVPELLPEAASLNLASKGLLLVKEENEVTRISATFESAKNSIQNISERIATLNNKMEKLIHGETVSEANIKHLAGAGGDWKKINERVSKSVVQQYHPCACVGAVGEMLTNGAIDQRTLMEAMSGNWGREILERWAERGKHAAGTIDGLARELGTEWKTARHKEAHRPVELEKLLRQNRPFGAELKTHEAMAHTVVVDGINEAGNICIRDPLKGTEYEMLRNTFIKIWSGVVFKN
jgi:hypothetical protein